MRKPKQKIHKHLAFDSDIFERAEEEALAENKSLNEWMNDAAHEKAERKSQKQQSQSQPQSQSEPHDIKHLTLDEAERIIRDQIIPSINECNPAIMDDKDTFVPLLRSARILLETIEIKQGSRKRVELKSVSYLDPFEQARQEGIRVAKERMEKNERLELMSALPQPIEIMKEIDIDTAIATDASVVTDALTTSSTARLDLTAAEWLVLKKQEEQRNKRLEKYKEEIAAEMRAQAKDSVKLVDESKEIPTEDDVRGSPADGDEGVYEDNSDKVPQDEF